MNEDPAMENPSEVKEDVVGIAQGNSDFRFLVSAFQEAELVKLFKAKSFYSICHRLMLHLKKL